MGSFVRAGKRPMAETRQRVQVLCLIPELMISRKVARELHMRPLARNNLGNRGCIGESGFDPVELWVMGPPRGLKVERVVTSCTVMIARQVRRQHVCYVGNQVWYQGRGTKRTIFLLVKTRRTNRQSSHPSVATGMSPTIVTWSH